jgi:hypothetical protein
MKINWQNRLSQCSLFLALGLSVLCAQSAHADALDDRIKADYKGLSSRPRTRSFPKRILVGRPPAPDTYESPNGHKITRVTSIAKPPPNVADGLYKTAYFAVAENQYWVHVTGGIAGFNYWEGTFKLAAPNLGPIPYKIMEGGSQTQYQNQAAEQLTFRNQANWNKWYSRHKPNQRAPAIDFTTDLVSVLLSGQKNSGGYGIKTTSVTRTAANQIVVAGEETAPRPGSFVTTVITYPYQIIRYKAARSDSMTYRIKGANTSTSKFSEIQFLRTNGSARKYELLTIESTGKAVYESRDPSGNTVLKRHQKTLGAQHLKDISKQIEAADFYKMADPSRQPGYNPPRGASIYTTKVEDNASNQANKISYHAVTPRSRTFNIFHKEMENMLDKLANVATGTSGFSTLTLRDVRPQGNGSNFNTTTTTTLNKDGSITRQVTAPNIRSVPVVGRVTTAELKSAVALYDATDFFNQVFPIPRFANGTPYTSFTADVSGKQKSVIHSVNSVSGPKGRQILALESFLRTLKIGSGTSGFSTLTLRDVRSQGNGSNFSTTTTTTLKSDGSITRFVTAPNIRSFPVMGRLAAADLKTATTLYVTTDFFNQRFFTPLFAPGTPLSTFTAEANGKKKGVTHPASTLGGAKGQDVLALEKFLRTANIIQGFRSFESISFSTALNGFILDVRSLKINKQGIGTWSQNRNGQQVSNETAPLGQGEINEIKRLYGATEFMNQSFRPFFPGAGASYNNLTVETVQATRTFGHPVGTYTGPKANEIKALESYLGSLLKRGANATARFDELNYKVVTLATKEREEIFVRGAKVQWRKADAAGNSIGKQQIKLTPVEADKLQKLFAGADYFKQPNTFIQTRRIMRSHDYTLSLKAAGQSKTISASIYADEPANFYAFRQELHNLLKRFKSAPLLTVVGQVSVLKSLPTQVIVSGSNGRYRVVGKFKDAVEALASRTVKVQGTKDRNGDLVVTAILSPKKVTFTGVVGSKGNNITLIKNNTSYVVIGSLASAVSRYNGKTLSVEALQFENTDLDVEKILLQARRSTYAFPLTRVRSGTKVDVIAQLGREFSLVRINNSARFYYMRTSDLKPRKVKKNVGLRGALRGSR